MKARYLIDSVILIDHFNGIQAATDWLAKLSPGQGAISVITLAEILAGVADEKEHERCLGFLSEFPCFSIHAETSLRAAALRKHNRWKLPDAFQMAIAQEHQLKLVTRNTKDFSTRKQNVYIPYTI